MKRTVRLSQITAVPNENTIFLVGMDTQGRIWTRRKNYSNDMWGQDWEILTSPTEETEDAPVFIGEVHKGSCL
jgi:hypothetical protein